jgi:site-specific DNA-methyltransferase (adenine-specific)
MPVICGDCKEVIKRMDDNSVDSIVTDPPAGIKFMGRIWDHDKGGRDQWIEWMTGIATECLRVIKPGGHALVWSLPRTSHWTATAWENGGFECRDSIVHIFGTGFPKSLDISKAIDKTLGAEREVVGNRVRVYGYEKDYPNSFDNALFSVGNNNKLTAPSTELAKQFSGFGTALKPAHEDWILLRKPVEGTIAQNVLKYGVGGINIDGCRIGETGARNNGNSHGTIGSNSMGVYGKAIKQDYNKGRFPANLIHDGSNEVLALFPNTQVSKGKYIRKTGDKQFLGVMGDGRTNEPDGLCDSGSAARFFYCAKPSPQERNIGCENLPHKTAGECTDRVEGSAGLNSPRAGAGRTNGSKNDHPTVKSISLMRYLCKLITPPNGIVLDPFCGSGSTGLAAYLEGFQCIMIDSDSHFCEIAEARMKSVIKGNNKLS